MKELYLIIKKYPKKKTGTSSTILTSTPEILERCRKVNLQEKKIHGQSKKTWRKFLKNVEQKLMYANNFIIKICNHFTRILIFSF